MNRWVTILMIAAAACVAAGPATAATMPAEDVPKEMAAAAMDYSQALIRGDLTASWRLLSSKSRAETGAVKWDEAFQAVPQPRNVAPSSLVKALAVAEPPVTTGEVAFLDGVALVQLGGVVQIERTIVLVKEGDRWLVDLAATDGINTRQAAEDFLQAVRVDAGAPQARAAGSGGGQLPMLRALLATEAKDYRVSQAEVEGDRAQVKLVCDMPVNAVIRAVRQGAGWLVDLSNPIVNTRPTSPNPLKEAAAVAQQGECQAQLRQVYQAIQMYASLSADLLPDPDRWVDQIRPYLADPAALHCPTDSMAGVSYAMNRNLAGKRRSEVGNPTTTPLLYESTLHTTNPADAGQSFPRPPVHGEGNLILFLDGSVRPAAQLPSFVVVGPQAGAPNPASAVGRTPPRARPAPELRPR